MPETTSSEAYQPMTFDAIRISVSREDPGMVQR